MSATKEHLHDQIEAGQRSKQHPISWLNMPGYKPETWNPIVGCSKVSPGCDNCYAERMATRLTGIQATKDNYLPVITNGKWNGTTNVCYNQLNWPMVWKSPRMIFVCSMGDLFHESIPFSWIDQVFDIITDCSDHIFIILTKRPERMKEYMDYRIKSDKFYGHSWVWLGVTAENQEQANKRIHILLQIPAAKRFVSIEPMLGPVDLTKTYHFTDHLGNVFFRDVLNEKSISGNEITNYPVKLDWVICGGESGPKARPMHPDLVRSVRDQCASANVPFFFKQWGEWMPTSRPLTSSEINVLPKFYASTGKFLQITDPWAEYYKAGKLKSGDKLDGLQHHEWPTINL